MECLFNIPIEGFFSIKQESCLYIPMKSPHKDLKEYSFHIPLIISIKFSLSNSTYEMFLTYSSEKIKLKLKSQFLKFLN